MPPCRLSCVLALMVALTRRALTFPLGPPPSSAARHCHHGCLLLDFFPALREGERNRKPHLKKPILSGLRPHSRLWSTTERESSSSSSSSSTVPPALDDKITAAKTSQAVAQAALNKLLQRQRSELEETERLLELVSNQEIDLATACAPTALSTAASLLSGVDYGFVGRSDGIPATLKGGLAQLADKYPGPPPNLWTLGTTQFRRNLKAMVGEYADEPDVHLTPQQVQLQDKLQQLTLNSTLIWEREYANGPIQAPWIIKLPYLAVCYLLDVVFEHRYVPSRFFLRKWTYHSSLLHHADSLYDLA
jgi:hypothetical protein